MIREGMVTKKSFWPIIQAYIFKSPVIRIRSFTMLSVNFCHETSDLRSTIFYVFYDAILYVNMSKQMSYP